MPQDLPAEPKICHLCGYAPAEPLATCPQEGAYLVPLSDHAALPDDPFLGRRFADRYPVVGLVGQGGMATVYRAVQEQVGREVALKVVRTDRHSREQLERRFVQEARVIARLRHPNIVTLYDAGVHEDGTLYMVMELIEGRPLSRVVGREVVLIARAVELAAGVLEALVEAHDHGLVHRDLKPANLMVVSGRRGEQVMVLDFGLAKALHPEDPVAANATTEGMVVGTPLYMSPEQAAGRPVDHRSDLYSLGVVLYELLAGRPPFGGDTAVEIAAAHCTRPPPPLPASRAVPPGLERVVMRALAKDPDGRFPDAASMLDALRRAHDAEEAVDTLDPTPRTDPTPGIGQPPSRVAAPPAAAPAPALPISPDWLVPTSSDRNAPGVAVLPEPPSNDGRSPHADARPAEPEPMPSGVLERAPPLPPPSPAPFAPEPAHAGAAPLDQFRRTRTASFRERHGVGASLWVVLTVLGFVAWRAGPHLVENVRLQYVLWQSVEAAEAGTGRLRVEQETESRLLEAGLDPVGLGFEVDADYTPRLELRRLVVGADYERRIEWFGADWATVLHFTPSFERSFE